MHCEGTLNVRTTARAKPLPKLVLLPEERTAPNKAFSTDIQPFVKVSLTVDLILEVRPLPFSRSPSDREAGATPLTGCLCL